MAKTTQPSDTSRAELLILAALAVVMLVTRSHSLSAADHLPDTSWASFFVAGYYIRSARALAALFLLGLAIDLVVIRLLGMPDYCFTAAYWLLVPAYGAMWGAGRWARARLALVARALPALIGLVTGASLVAELISSGGFYAVSGRFAAPTLAGFLPRLIRYWPMDLLATLGWVGAALVCHIALVLIVPAMRVSRR